MIRFRSTAYALLVTLVACGTASAQAVTPLVGIGDSIGEGVQSGDASEYSQPFSFLNLIAWRMGAPFPLPLIRTNVFGAVGSTDGRSRVLPAVQSPNLAVSGADVQSVLFDRALATDVSQIKTETELVLFPRIGSQMEIAESLRAKYVVCWIGNNDALGAVLAFDHLDASQLTPIDQFTADFTQIADRLAAAGSKVVFATIPDLTSIAYVLTRQDLVRFLGSAYGLPNGNVTTLPTMLLIKLGLLPTSVLSDPNFVLDPIEQQRISGHINALNAVIQTVAHAHGMAVVDMNAIYRYLASQTTDIAGITITSRFLGGLFSLDGVHPSNVGHALSAYFFIDELNRSYGAGIPQIDNGSLFWFVLTDPFIDKDHDGKVAGRFGAGMLETLMSIVGFSGDSNDAWTPPATAAATTMSTESVTTDGVVTSSVSSRAALDEYRRRTGQDLRHMSRAQRLAAFHALFAVPDSRK